MSENQSQNKAEFKIDLTYLRDVSSGSNEFMIEMIELFLDQTPAYFDQLKQYIAEENWSKVAEIAHKIKPTLAFMGADSAKESMAEIENNARSLTNTNSIGPAFEMLYEFSGDLFNKLTEVKKELEQAG
ncbi:Hpt domain-containing protein [Daejeonella lutea]|uniref:HPt (Histidine-containing phosphotransfer) domain-containing protein n=1 Tax=Daejeonella lutea TaxID=572036 RepID=A0A1T5AUQ3_9SPHI|nr:Hpt domain-containing protein [Daejeonella lutea]SKB38675.1 HPt (histidine-containing phosphotransfer) domain-containing protein [Daejeonella lutea]